MEDALGVGGGGRRDYGAMARRGEADGHASISTNPCKVTNNAMSVPTSISSW